MATTNLKNFIPELWSQELIETMKQQVWDLAVKTRRSKGTQLLRDAALGHPEYPEPPPKLNMTATEMRLRHEQMEKTYTMAAKAMADDIDKHILDSFIYGSIDGVGKRR